MKILFISPLPFDTCSFYRAGGIAPDLSIKLGCDIHVTSLEKEKFTWQDLLSYNLVMFQRPFTETTFQLGMYVKSLGIPLWVDMDDNMLDLPVGNPAYELLTRNRDTIIKMVALADVCSTSTELLRQQLLPHNKNVKVIPNAFNDYVFKRRGDALPRQKIIVWRGGDSHTPDLMRYAAVIDRMMHDFNDWDFKFMGLLPWFYSNYGNLSYVQQTDPIFFFRKLVAFGPTAIHVPLDDSVFNRCKSNIAWIEGAYCGAVCIAPDWDEWKMPGVMAFRDDEEYYSLVKKVVSGEIDAKKNADKSWAYITDKLMLSKINKLRVDLVKSLLS